MGTYTSNYNLFMPTVGEQGWGELVNGNFATIDTTMKSLNNRIGTLETETNALETETDALAADIAALETVCNGGDIKSKSITNSGTITSTGMINANGGIKGKIVSKYYDSGTILGLSMDFPAVSLSGQDSLNATSSIPLKFVRPEFVSNYFLIEEDLTNATGTFTFTYTYVPAYYNSTCGFGLYDSNGTELYQWTQYNAPWGTTNTTTITLPLTPASYYFKKIGPVGTATRAEWAISAMSYIKYIF